MEEKRKSKPFTSEQARESGRKGGIASGKARRRKKCLKEAMETLLYLPAAGEEDVRKAAEMGFPEKDIDNLLLVALGLFQKAKNGDVSAVKQIIELTADKNQNMSDRLIIQLVDDMTIDN